jgi:hypothetical protein
VRAMQAGIRQDKLALAQVLIWARQRRHP